MCKSSLLLACNSTRNAVEKKISHNLIPQQCKPKHFPATQNAILRIYFGSQREWYVNFTLFLAIWREILVASFCIFAPISIPISSICQMELWRKQNEGNNSKTVGKMDHKLCWKIKLFREIVYAWRKKG